MNENSLTIIAAVQPFRIGVHFDGDEYLPKQNADLTKVEDTAQNGEFLNFPGGIIGMYSPMILNKRLV